MSQDLGYIENNDLCDIIAKDLKVLEIFKKHLYIRIALPLSKEKYLVILQEDKEQSCEHAWMCVDEREKQLLEGWLEK